MRTGMQGLKLAAVVAGFAVSVAAWASGPAAGLVTGGWDALSSASMAAKTQGYLGVDIRDVGDEQIGALKLKESRGAEIIHVDHDGPAGKVGLRQHDVILQMNGTVIEGEDQLRRMLRETPAGRTVTFLFSRDGQQQNVTTQLANRYDVERQAWEQRWRVPQPLDDTPTGGTGSQGQPAANGQSSSNNSGSSAKGGQSFFSPGTGKSHSLMGALSLGSTYTGAMVETMGPQLAEFFGTNGGGVLVHSVDANSPAANAGLRAGDVVVRVNSTKMTSSGDWAKMIHENRGKPVQVVVLRDKKEQSLTLVPDGKKRSSLEWPWLPELFRGGDRQPPQLRGSDQ